MSYAGKVANVVQGGTGDASFSAYSLIAGGTTTTGALQNISGVGTSGQVLTSNGASALPTWQAAVSSGITFTGDSGTPFTTTSVTIYANHISNACGSSVLFKASTPYITLQLTDSNSNTIVGNASGNASLSGSSNTSFGTTCIQSLTMGLGNTTLGAYTGSSYTSSESYNLLLGVGTGGIAGETSTIHIADFTSSFPAQSCSIGGIYSSTPSGGLIPQVTLTDSNGGMSTIPSSTSGYVLTSNGFSTPSFQPVGSSSITFSADSGSPITGTSFTISGGSTGLTTMTVGASSIDLGGDLLVSYGGTGSISFTPYAPVVGGTSSTGALQSAGTNFGTSGYVLTSQGSSSVPIWSAVEITLSGDSGGPLTSNSFTISGGGTGLTFSGSGTTETLGGTLAVGNGGTGVTSFTPYALLAGGSSTIQQVSGVGTSGQVLTSNGASAYPTWQTSSTSISITGNSGGALTGNAFTFTGGTTGLTFSGSGTTETLTGTLALANGGTNANLTANNGGIFYSTATAGAILAGTATAGQMLRSGATAAPTWSTATWPATTTINQILYSSAANTVTGLATANDGVLTTSATGVPIITALSANGQLIIGSGSGAPAAATLTAGAGITVTNGANSITIASTYTPLPFTVETANTALVKQNGYFSNSASTLTYTLPTVAAVGDTYVVAAMSSGAIKIGQNAGQNIIFNSSTTTTGTGGSILSTSTGATITIVCNVANNGFQVINSMGTFTVT